MQYYVAESIEESLDFHFVAEWLVVNSFRALKELKSQYTTF